MRSFTRREWSEEQIEKYAAARAAGTMTTGGAFAYVFKMMLARLIWTIKDWFWTVAWLSAFVVVMAMEGIANNLIWIALFAAVHLGGFFWRPLWKVAGLTGDLSRRRKRKYIERAVLAGEDFVYNSGMGTIEAAKDSQSIYTVEPNGDFGTLLITNTKILGKSPAALLNCAKQFQHLMGEVVRVEGEVKDPNTTEFRFIFNDPLDKSIVLDAPKQLEPNKMAVPAAVNELGQEVPITFGGASGMVIGGMPGGGKTAAVTQFLMPLVMSKYARVTLIDAKGADDWDNYRDAVDQFVAGTDYTLIAQTIDKFVEGMDARKGILKQKLGVSNFWNADADKRDEAGLTFNVLVFDESHLVLNDAGLDKEEKALNAHITRQLQKIASIGRSLGHALILITQKPTADNIPTKVRDVCALRIALRLQNADMERAVFGVSPEEGPHAYDIPSSRPGGAVIGTESGSYEAVRFYYMPENVQERYLKEFVKNKKGANDIASVINEPVDDGGWTIEEIA